MRIGEIKQASGWVSKKTARTMIKNLLLVCSMKFNQVLDTLRTWRQVAGLLHVHGIMAPSIIRHWAGMKVAKWQRGEGMNPTRRHFKLLWQVSQHNSPQPERNPSQIWRADGLEGALHFRTVQAEVSLYCGGCANSVFAMKLSVLEPGLQANEPKRIKAGTLQQEPTYWATCQHQMEAMNSCVPPLRNKCLWRCTASLRGGLFEMGQ